MGKIKTISSWVFNIDGGEAVGEVPIICRRRPKLMIIGHYRVFIQQPCPDSLSLLTTRQPDSSPLFQQRIESFKIIKVTRSQVSITSMMIISPVTNSSVQILICVNVVSLRKKFIKNDSEMLSDQTLRSAIEYLNQPLKTVVEPTEFLVS